MSSVVLTLALGACGAPPITDAGADAEPDRLALDAGVAIEPTIPIPPAPPASVTPPAPPRFGACPSGWTATRGACEPWPDGRLPECEAGEAAFPGVGCARIGSACPADGWPVELPTDRELVFVRAGADPSVADGSRDRPYGSIQRGVDRAGGTDVVVVGTGHYDEVLWISRSVTVIGACAADTVLAPTRSTTSHAIDVVGGLSSRIQDVTVRAPLHADAIVVQAEAALHLERVHVDGALRSGLVARGRITGQDVVIEDVAADSTWHTASAIVARDAGVVELRRVVARGGMRAAVEAYDGGQVRLEDAALHRIEPRWVAPWNVIVFVHHDASVTLRRTVIEQIESNIVTARDRGTLRLEDVVIRDAPSPVLVHDGGRVEGQRVLVERARGAAVYVFNGGSIELADAVLREIRPGEDGWGGFGIWIVGEESAAHFERARIESAVMHGAYVETGAELAMVDTVIAGTRARPGVDDGDGLAVYDADATLERCAFLDNRRNGLSVGGAEAQGRAVLRDVSVRGTQPSRGPEGNGLFVGPRGLVEGERVEIAECTGHGMKLWNGGVALLSDVAITGVLSNDVAIGGNGIWITEGSRLELTRAVIRRTRPTGIGLDGTQRESASIASSAVLRDVVIAETESDGLLGLLGNALRAANGATVEIERALFEDNREAAVSAQNPGTRVTLSDVVIRATRPRGCADRDLDPCPASIAGGCGLTVFNAGDARLSRFVVAEGALCGVMVAEAGRLELHEGEVRQNPIGANVQVEGYDLALLTDRVRYVDNARNYDGARLPVPDESAPTLP